MTINEGTLESENLTTCSYFTTSSSRKGVQRTTLWCFGSQEAPVALASPASSTKSVCWVLHACLIDLWSSLNSSCVVEKRESSSDGGEVQFDVKSQVENSVDTRLNVSFPLVRYRVDKNVTAHPLFAIFLWGANPFCKLKYSNTFKIR